MILMVILYNINHHIDTIKSLKSSLDLRENLQGHPFF